jgi:hypothetical protein
MALPTNTTGAPLNLFLPEFDYGTFPGDDTWDVPANDNLNAINTFAASAIIKAPTASQTIAQPASTYLNIDSLIVYGSLPALRLGTAVNIWDTSLSRTAAGKLSVDTNTVGNGAGIITAAGYQVNGGAANGFLLVGNGTSFVPSATLPAGTVKYQTIELAGTPLTQRAFLNFLSPLTAVDDSGNNSTDIGLAASGVAPGSYIAPTITVDTYGRVTAAAASTLSRVVNSNGWYIRFPDGTLLQGGTITVSASGNAFNTGSVTYPTAFSTAAAPVITSVGIPSTTGDATTPMACEIQSASLSGFTAYMARVIVASAGGGNFDQSFTLSWQAFGY